MNATATIAAPTLVIGKAERNMRGELAATTDLTLSNGYKLRVSTCKRSSGGVSTHATAGKVKVDNGFNCFSFIMFRDYSIDLVSDRAARATEKTVNAQHAAALADPAALIAAADAFYAVLTAKEAAKAEAEAAYR